MQMLNGFWRKVLLAGFHIYSSRDILNNIELSIFE